MGNGVRTLRRERKNRGRLALLITLIVCLAIGKLFSDMRGGIFLVGSSSMHPALPKNSVVIVVGGGFNELKPNDIIAFKSTALGGKPALHRVVRVESEGVFTKGDANKNEDNQLITQSDYIGKCVLAITFIARYFIAISHPLGFICFFLAPIGVVICLCWFIRERRTG